MSSESVAPVQLPLGSKSLKSAQQTMATWLSPQATTPPESPHLKQGSGNKRVQVNSPDPSSSVHISRGSWGPKPSDLAGDVISMSNEGINSPPWTTLLSKSVHLSMPHRPTQLSYAQMLASPGQQHKGGSSADKTRMKFLLSEPPPAKVVNPYDCPSRHQATFNDDANETQMFSSADENPWDGYDSSLDDESASEEESTSKDKAGAHTGEKAKDAAWSRVHASFIARILMLMNNNCVLML